MGEKRSSPVTSDVLDMSLKCKCIWRWDSSSSSSHDRVHLGLGGSSCLRSLTFFSLSFAMIISMGFVLSWLMFSPSGSFPPGCCNPDNEGSWSVGMYFGTDPFSLRPIEMGNFHSNETSAWPVANPILNCASASLPSHPSNFVADPFLYVQDGKLYVFFETKNAITMQGDIGVAESTDGGISWRNLGIALDEEWHLSYPFVFSYNGQLVRILQSHGNWVDAVWMELKDSLVNFPNHLDSSKIYMMPEGSKRGDLRLYRALRFPLHWTLERVLINKPLVDASMVEYSGKFWLFASNFPHFGSHNNGELEIYFSESPLGPWQAHKRNPVYSSDTKVAARNGGRPFFYDGGLYRIGQDCRETYGKRIRVFHVDKLSADDFQESERTFSTREWKKGKNSWNGIRYHHLDLHQLHTGEWIAVMDGDRVSSGDISKRYLTGSAAFFILLVLVLLLGKSFGVVYLSRVYDQTKKIAMACLCTRPYVTTYKSQKTLTRLHRSGTAVSSRAYPSSCLASLFLFVGVIISLVCIYVEIKCFLWGNGAEEPYAVSAQYSQFTLLTMTYDARLWNLKMYIKHYSRCASVREIVVVWNKGIPPDPATDFDSTVPVRMRVEKHNSLNNRFKPDPLIKTRAVLELDDDIMMTCDDVERGFKAWREHPERIVGFYPRLIDGSPLKYRNEKYARNRREYNMILTGAAFLDSETAFSRYWSGVAGKGRALVDELFNCEDILMNFVVANSTTTKSRMVEYIHPAWAIDTSKFSSSAISRDTSTHYLKRTNCLLMFSQLFGGLPLRRWEFGMRQDGWDS